ncbi:MATE family efflux transporter [Allobaculum stercoricanis]|uniref:MATE family efflux transporter n=1 Tax=Allobaculum stercoricanis TaxID=174709 RepID=UPI0023F0929B|nr:MATE family efflux transporter [Allobaculum stercoricanis]
MKHQVSLIQGDLKRAIVIFAIPLFFSQLFQTLYNTMDTVIIGHVLGDFSLAAVGAVASLFELIVGFCTGFGQGLGVIAAQKFGAGNMKGFRRVAGLSIELSLVVSFVLAIVAGLNMETILNFMHTSSDIFDLSYSYIIVICWGLPITIFYNLCAGMLRAAGDSITPLVILLISSVTNIALDLLFITTFNMGVAGTAWATLLAQLLSLVICVIWMLLKKRELLPSLSEMKWDTTLARHLTEMGLSMAFMSSIVSAGTLILQIGINQLGTLIVTGHTAARKLVGMLNLPVIALMQALSSFVAQNIGAQQYERAEKGIAFVNRFGLYYSILLSVIVMFVARYLIAMISGSTTDVVLDTGALYLRTNIPFFPVLAVLLDLRISLQSMSLKIVPIISSVIELVGKIIFTLFIVPTAGYLGICFTEPVVWIAMCLFLGYFYLRNRLFKENKIATHIFR